MLLRNLSLDFFFGLFEPHLWMLLGHSVQDCVGYVTLTVPLVALGTMCCWGYSQVGIPLVMSLALGFFNTQGFLASALLILWTKSLLRMASILPDLLDGGACVSLSMPVMTDQSGSTYCQISPRMAQKVPT